MNEIIKKALLEMGRIMAIAAIPLLVDGLTQGMINWRVIAIAVVIAGLKFWDKLLHEYGKTEGNEKFLKGLTRF